jgi:hypothetical protein
MEDLRNGYPQTLTVQSNYPRIHSPNVITLYNEYPVGTISGFYLYEQTEQLRKEFEIRNIRTAHRLNESELRTNPRIGWVATRF